MTMAKFYLTTSIAYVNAPPHIGFALESIQADVLARYRRQKGDDVFFLTGTDEHGTKIFRTAQATGATPQEFTDKISDRFRALKEALNLSWDYFIRTSDQANHWPNAVALWRKMAAAGDIYEKEYEGLYCVGHESFITEKELVDGLCSDHRTRPETVKEKNCFFKLSRYAEAVAKKIESDELLIVPVSKKNEILSFIRQGVQDVSFSRPKNILPWGIPVPGDPSQVMYVWADALANYLYPRDYWPAAVHIIGKDILRFHALFWPAMLLSAGLPLPKKIFAHGFITADGEKMSKSRGNVVDPFVLAEKYGADALRYYLLREIPAYDDGDFSQSKFEERYNSDLANGLGNFAARVSTLAGAADLLEREPGSAIKEACQKTAAVVNTKLEELRFNEALISIMELIGTGDKYMNDNEPWKKEGEAKTTILLSLIYLLYCVADNLMPFLPEAAQKIKSAIVWDGKIYRVKKIENLFPRLS